MIATVSALVKFLPYVPDLVSVGFKMVGFGIWYYHHKPEDLKSLVHDFYEKMKSGV